MSLYAVRIKKGHELVGFFNADGPSELFWLVDEVTDPSVCEYARLPSGGLLWQKADLTIPSGQSFYNDMIAAGAVPQMTEGLRDRLETRAYALRWKEIPSYGEQAQ